MARTGCQEPTFTTVGEWAYSDGSEAVDMFGDMGAEFAPAQVWELTVYLARNKFGRFAARTIALSKPRQNGKSHAARYYAVWMAAVDGMSVLYTAHHGDTTRKMFKAIEDIVSHPDMAQYLKPGSAGIYRSKGSEGIYFADWVDDDGNWHRGGFIEFSTRTNSGGRGGTYDIIIVDEAQELTDEQFDALKPTTIASESSDPQMIYLGTPPNEKCPGTVFKRLHDQAHAGHGGSAWWIEWAADDVGDPHDSERWYRCVPMLGILIDEDVLSDAADTASPDGFAREYLGWWSKDAGGNPALSRDKWFSCKTSKPPAPSEGEKVAYGVKFSVDGRSYAISAAAKPEDGPVLVECIDTGSTSNGINVIADWLSARKGKCSVCVIDGKSHAAELERKLRDAKLPDKAIKVAGTSDVCAAASMLKDAVDCGDLVHTGQPTLTESAIDAQKRDIGKGGGWGFGDGKTPCAPIESASLALYGVNTTKRRPGRKAKAL